MTLAGVSGWPVFDTRDLGTRDYWRFFEFIRTVYLRIKAIVIIVRPRVGQLAAVMERTYAFDLHAGAVCLRSSINPIDAKEGVFVCEFRRTTTRHGG